MFCHVSPQDLRTAPSLFETKKHCHRILIASPNCFDKVSPSGRCNLRFVVCCFLGAMIITCSPTVLQTLNFSHAAQMHLIFLIFSIYAFGALGEHKLGSRERRVFRHKSSQHPEIAIEPPEEPAPPSVDEPIIAPHGNVAPDVGTSSGGTLWKREKSCDCG